MQEITEELMITALKQSGKDYTKFSNEEKLQHIITMTASSTWATSNALGQTPEELPEFLKDLARSAAMKPIIMSTANMIKKLMELEKAKGYAEGFTAGVEQELPETT